MVDAPVIEATEVTAPLRLLDVRDATSFAAGHPPGAVRVPIEDWVAAARTPDGSFDNTPFWSRAIGALGLGARMVAGIYDDGRMTEAARVWFILQHFGLEAVILNGGRPAVEAAGLSGVGPNPVPPSLVPASGRIGLVSRPQLKQTFHATTIFDARTEAEHRGQDLKANARGGHLPGALLLPHRALLDGSRLRAADDLRLQLVRAGFTPDRPITTHCDGGGRAALAAVAALRAGFSPVSVYYLSFADWAADESCPIITPV